MKTKNSTVVNHEIRKKLSISINEYILIDYLFFLNGHNWCDEKRKEIAEWVGVTRQGLDKLINRLIMRGFIEKDLKSNSIKITKIWTQNS